MNKVEAALNDQIKKEASSSQYYLSMASWAESNGLNGTANFMYTHSMSNSHMLKLVKFVNERGGRGTSSSIRKTTARVQYFKSVFESLLEHEIGVTASNNLVDIVREKDYTTHNFVQWYVSEQLEEKLWL